jgi:hypothetical protein
MKSSGLNVKMGTLFSKPHYSLLAWLTDTAPARTRDMPILQHVSDANEESRFYNLKMIDRDADDPGYCVVWDNHMERYIIPH